MISDKETPKANLRPDASDHSGEETPIQTFYQGRLFDPLGTRGGLTPLAGVPSHGLPPFVSDLRRLRLEHQTLTFDLIPGSSFFGDCLRVVDVPEEKPLALGLPPFGWTGKPLLGGFALTASELSGNLVLSFGTQNDNLLPFTLSHPGGLNGESSVLTAPDGYFLKSFGNAVVDVQPVSHGSVDLATGRVLDFHYNLSFFNSAIEALLKQNPNLHAPPLRFPGAPHAGHALAWITLKEDDRLLFNVAAQQFLPLGPSVDDVPITMPASQSDRSRRNPFVARNSSLHPFIVVAAEQRVNSRPRAAGTIGNTKSTDASSVYLENREVRFTCLPTKTNFGDDFALRSFELGGGGLAQSPLFGSVVIQFGSVNRDYLPFVLSFEAPTSLRSKFMDLLKLLPPGTAPGLVGLSGELAFPKVKYMQHNLSLNTDPYKLSVGIMNVRTGRVENPVVLRKYLFQDLMMSLLRTEPRTPTDSFSYIATGAFSKSDSGFTIFRLTGELYIPYPEGYGFPLPNGGRTAIERGSYLKPFVNLMCIEDRAFQPAKGDLLFVGTEHIRGNFPGGLIARMSLSGEGVHVLNLQSGGLAYEGTGRNVVDSTVEAMTVRMGEYCLQTSNGPEQCVCIVSLTRDKGDFQIISAHETFDSWYCNVGGSLSAD